MKRLLMDIEDNYDFVIIDCPPSVGLLTLNALSMADGVIIPIKSNDFSSLDGFANAVDRGVAEKADELQWLFPNLTVEEREEKLARIEANKSVNEDEALEKMLRGE